MSYTNFNGEGSIFYDCDTGLVKSEAQFNDEYEQNCDENPYSLNEDYHDRLNVREFKIFGGSLYETECNQPYVRNFYSDEWEKI